MSNFLKTQSNQKEITFKLILKSVEFPLASDFPYLSDVNPTIYSELLTNHRYYIKSNVKEEVIQSFINHWVKKEIPDINVSNLSDYIQLSQEFERMTDLIKIFLNHTSNISISTLLHKKKTLNNKMNKRNEAIQLYANEYNSIIDSFFNSNSIKNTTEFNEFKSKLLSASLKYEFNSNDISSEKILNINGLQYLLNEKEKTAGVLEANTFNDHVFIPRSVSYNSEDYLVTKILENSFKSNQFITEIEFPEDSELKEIEKDAFLNSRIERITIPKHVTKICEAAFSYCNSLYEVTFSEGSELKTIERNAFSDTFIDTLAIPSGVEDLQKGWCSGTNSLNTIIVIQSDRKNVTLHLDKLLLGKSFVDSNEYDILLFACRDIEEIIVPPFVKRIAPYAFDGNELLRVFDYMSNSQLQIIEECAFSNSSIAFVNIPPCVTSIEAESFICCPSLHVVNFPMNSELKSIGDFAFSESSIEELVIPSSVINFGKAWCNGTELLTQITIHQNQFENVKLYDNHFIIGKSNPYSQNFDVLLFACRDIEKATIPAFIKTIAPLSFDSCKSLREINFAENSQLQIIASSAFYNSHLEAIKIPPSVVEIRKRSFQCCDNFKRVDFDDHSELKKIGRYAFSYNSIGMISIPSKVDEIGNSWCFNANCLERVTIDPKNQNFIQNGPFTVKKSKSGNFDTIILVNKNIVNVKIPSFIKTIDCNSFTNCRKLKHIEFEDNSELEFIHSNAFDSSSLIEISFPSKVKSIKSHAFAQCESIQKVDFSNNSNLRFINKFAFYKTAIGSIIVPPSLSFIGSFAFAHCDNLGIVEIPENSELSYINSEAFNKSPVSFVMMPVNSMHIKSFFK